MKVIVDTDVWSEALRKEGDEPSSQVRELGELIENGSVQMVGIIRMEILCGIRDEKRFKKLKEAVAAFPDRQLDTEVFELAAVMFNQCRGKGVQGSMTDFVLCACSALWQMPIMTKDKDFKRYQRHLPIELHTPRK
ncbi:MAG: PIN domain-containing protein [Verrucomicrobia subdivision 3 bacterium]|nr:PIN domain-containing protein [Limisphaerales bacterium]